MTKPAPPSIPTPAQTLAIRRHLASAEGAHLLCRRKACRRAGACRQDGACRSGLYGEPGAGLIDDELMHLRIAYFLDLLTHWARLPAIIRSSRKRPRRAPPPGRGEGARRRST